MNRFQKQLLINGESMVHRMKDRPALVPGFEEANRQEAEDAGEPLPPVKVTFTEFERDRPRRAECGVCFEVCTCPTE